MWSKSGDGPHAIDVVAQVRSPNVVTSPLSGRRGAFVHLEVLERPWPERLADAVTLGEVILGDIVSLEVALEPSLAGASVGVPRLVDVVVRRATLRFASLRGDPVAMDVVPPELAPMLGRAKGGALVWREHLVLQRDRLRLRAVAERRGEVVVLRDDLAPINLDEVLALPDL